MYLSLTITHTGQKGSRLLFNWQVCAIGEKLVVLFILFLFDFCFGMDGINDSFDINLLQEETENELQEIICKAH